MLTAYAQGIFPMAESIDAPTYDFYRPEMRGQLSIDDLHIPSKLLRTIKKFPYEITINKDFEGVIDGCAKSKKGRTTTWINAPIKQAFLNLHEAGYAHSVECWEDNQLIGGLYGLAIGAVFCGESMFSTATDASKIALIHLCARLQAGGFTVLDTQFTNPHLEQFGITEIPQKDYEALIKIEMNKKTDFILEGQNEEDIVLNYIKR